MYFYNQNSTILNEFYEIGHKTNVAKLDSDNLNDLIDFIVCYDKLISQAIIKSHYQDLSSEKHKNQKEYNREFATTNYSDLLHGINLMYKLPNLHNYYIKGRLTSAMEISYRNKLLIVWDLLID